MSEDVQDPLNDSEGAWMAATHLSNSLPTEGVYVAFTTPTCGPCKAMKPVLEKTALELNRHFYIVDATEVKGLAVAFNVRAVPTVLRLVDGMPQVARLVGAQSEDKIREFMRV
jgi:putative thioredoxin